MCHNNNYTKIVFILEQLSTRMSPQVSQSLSVLILVTIKTGSSYSSRQDIYYLVYIYALPVNIVLQHYSMNLTNKNHLTSNSICTQQFLSLKLHINDKEIFKRKCLWKRKRIMML